MSERMNDLITGLRIIAKNSMAGTEYAPDEHIAWQAADKIAELEAKLEVKLQAVAMFLEQIRDYPQDCSLECEGSSVEFYNAIGVIDALLEKENENG